MPASNGFDQWVELARSKSFAALVDIDIVIGFVVAKQEVPGNVRRTVPSDQT